MNEPDRQPTLQQPEVAADASTARPRSPWHPSRIPSHLGRARTSTVVLSLLFLAIGTLWLQIRPDPDRPSTAGTGTEQPAVETTPAPETTPPEETTDPAPSTAPTPSTGPTSTPTRTPTGTPTGTPDGTPDGTTTPEETTDEDTPTTSAPSLPTETGTGSAPG
ncbi:hypothetical protein FHU33_0295 [Blastococcus colisei]|uniref:Uncharacterized protein n=1 Tax=Blastococcus colisei TaxID=1564162 RepID=A0A543PA34_9ACTN|nr:hypothetical protein [Blastococcus colisei]TQN40943.1 hypothetical protein FHU33_0295 [Blastococcus colisei]